MSGKKVLVVDDSATERAHVVGLLKKNGFETIEVDNGMKGVLAAVEHKPNLIIMDIVMPELNGFQATKKIVADPVTKNIPVIILSSKSQASDRFASQTMGAKGYLVKPVAEKDLLEQISKLIQS